MAEVLLFHHALGRTSGFLAFADELRRAGHTVHAPDLYGGCILDTLEAGVAYAGEIGFGEIIERGVRAADGLPAGLVYACFSLGVLPAQTLAQPRGGGPRGHCCPLTRTCRVPANRRRLSRTEARRIATRGRATPSGRSSRRPGRRSAPPRLSRRAAGTSAG